MYGCERCALYSTFYNTVQLPRAGKKHVQAQHEQGVRNTYLSTLRGKHPMTSIPLGRKYHAKNINKNLYLVQDVIAAAIHGR